MNNIEFGKLEEIKDLRKYWKDEASDFTPWLAKEENISLLSEAIGIEEISDIEIESPVGSFKVDIYASETETDRKIIIENQLEATNHEHLGKLITYASGKSANIIIWIVKEAREEHRAAIEWLNNHTDDEIGFFLCEIKIYKIGNSNLAVKFEVIQRPNEWAKEVKNKDLTQTQQLRYEYWTAYNDYFSKNKKYVDEFNKRKPSKFAWTDLSIGYSYCNMRIWRTKDTIQVQLYIPDNKELFDKLYNKKDDIEKEIEIKFHWQNHDDKKSSHITIERNAEFDDREKWEEQFDWIMETAIKMKKTFTKYI
ncbi:DUF4268 domain-containing protein [Brachyspira catarrhinii]|uniref:DUF4268 domain-containing protein n=1 Tax=Brachyspira catarrhinii TaxID=2528966 RepID=A0ABY2TU76_9SPIR|nr:DUF4268 domain-containing protein [Brachyspira catarrhinii]TKZ35442.1 DUF4268 domain-containing protein [Brachyspira catarrhinii]